MQEDTRICLTVIAVIAILALAALGGCHEVYSVEREALKAGLVEKQMAGSTYKQWVKP